jgi:glycosyltransferase involved in cell wall biosynthesis
MRVHIASLPHTEVTRDWDHCAYTAKVRRFSGMLAARGHEPITYSPGAFTGTGLHVDVPGIVWPHTQVFDRWEHQDTCWTTMNAAIIDAMGERFTHGDVIGIIAGRCQQQIIEAFPGELAVEWGVGYEGVLEHTPHAFESQAWRHYVSGARGWDDGRHFDAVIPNAFDPDDYELGEDEGYLLFLGRHTDRKGVEIVRELAKTHRVVTAGQDGPLEGIEYRGIVLGDDKKKLLAGATAVLVPTLYVEPFGGVAVEAMMSGVPAITTSFGAFTETVQQGKTGYRCDTLGQFRAAVDRASLARSPGIREDAVARYSTGAVAPLYDEWLNRCQLLHGDGWYG